MTEPDISLLQSSRSTKGISLAALANSGTEYRNFYAAVKFEAAKMSHLKAFRRDEQHLDFYEVSFRYTLGLPGRMFKQYENYLGDNSDAGPILRDDRSDISEGAQLGDRLVVPTIPGDTKTLISTHVGFTIELPLETGRTISRLWKLQHELSYDKCFPRILRTRKEGDFEECWHFELFSFGYA
jgi:hypothetical protein